MPPSSISLANQSTAATPASVMGGVAASRQQGSAATPGRRAGFWACLWRAMHAVSLSHGGPPLVGVRAGAEVPASPRLAFKVKPIS